MRRVLIKQVLLGALQMSLLFIPGMALRSAAQESIPASDQSVITNLLQLTRALQLDRRAYRDVRLEATVCAASSPMVGVLIGRDETGVELLQIGNFEQEIRPGEKIQIRGWHCLLRKREMGIELSTGPMVDNDGLHIRRTWGRNATLKAGLAPIRLDWFNCSLAFNLETFFFPTNGSPRNFDSSNLWHAVVDESGQTNLMPGLIAECYEGYWESVPDFQLLKPLKTGVVTNFDAGFRTRNDKVGIRFTGYLNVPADGRYGIRVRSDDGSLLFLGKPELPVVKMGSTNVPIAGRGLYGEAMKNLSERRWLEIEGRVGFVAEKGRGLEFDLRSDRDEISVRVADAAGIDPARLLKSHVKVRGIGQGVLTMDQRIVLGRVSVASAADVIFVQDSNEDGLPSPIVTVSEVQNLPIEEARRARPVRIRGVITDARNSIYDHWLSIQDDTRGIFVRLQSISNAMPAFGEFWEIEGLSGAGDFAPVVMAKKMTLLGAGRLPEPARPSWPELLNGRLDVQWAELQGLVTDVKSNRVALLLPEGRLEVQMDGYDDSKLRPFLKSIVRIRGVFYAVWNAETRAVRVGNILMRNATVSMATPAPAAPFDAILKTPRELFLFDAQASAFQRIKVRGQVVHAEANRIFIMDGGAGLQILPTQPDDSRAGDLIEAVGYLEISGPSPLLREAMVRKTGEAPLPAARVLGNADFAQGGLDSTRVSVRGKLLGMHQERDKLVLEMQSDAQLFLARLGVRRNHTDLQIGSRLALTGVYAGRSSSRTPGNRIESFDLLLNSPADIAILAKPPWWTLQRLLTVVGVLLVGLMLAAGWIALLRRQVEQRTAQLQREVRERERAERQHAIEAERTRIARDLHDDLGSSLTEISVLASTGQRPIPEVASPSNLFRAIATRARGLIAALDVIVWAVDPEDNSLQSLADYLSGFTREFLAHSSMTCRFKVPVTFPPVMLDGQVRHGLLMAVKESLNNVMRHADATEAEFRMAVADGTLEIVIADNGRGFDSSIARDGHGLKNLSARLKKLGGNCVVESRVSGGTIVTIRLVLPVPVS